MCVPEHADDIQCDIDEEVPDHVKQKLRYPTVRITNRTCNRGHCEARLLSTGIKSIDMKDDAGYIIGHKEKELFECFEGHRMSESI